jgi:hypothetical protein
MVEHRHAHALACHVQSRGATQGRYWSIILRWTFHFESEHSLQLAP